LCYTGMYAKKTGNYTKKQYLQVMNKHFKKKCSVYVRSKKCLNKPKCNRKTKKCNLKQYIDYTGADWGKCSNT